MPTDDPTSPRFVDHAVSALSAWLGDHLESSGNPLHTPLALYANNRPVEPAALPPPESGRVAVLVHGLACNEGLWAWPRSRGTGDYGLALEARLGYRPLYVRYNTGLRISDNGRALAALLETWASLHATTLSDLVLIGHSMGGLVLRSACHEGREADWAAKVRHVFYLGSPHLGAPLERTANVASGLLGAVDTTATRVIREVLDSRSSGVKDLRYGLGSAASVPWLPSARHHHVVGEVIPGLGLVGDGIVQSHSAGPDDALETVLLPGLDHLSLARHPAVLEAIAERLADGCP
ncbi:MAG: alpha/beta hydrolase [Myxococcota bacterium]